MLEINKIKENKQSFLKSLKLRNFNAEDFFEKILLKEKNRKSIIKENELLLNEANLITKEIELLYRNKQLEKIEILKKKSSQLKKKSKELQAKISLIEVEIKNLLLEIPNIPNKLVPSGSSELDNEIILESGSIPTLFSEAKPHWELLKKYNLVDFDLGNKITGSGFPIFIDKGARLQRALITYFLDKNIEAGYVEYAPPYMVNKDSAYCTGQLPKFEDDLYKVSGETELYLIPTAEIPVTNMFKDLIVDNLPLKCTSYTPCFRREAGSYGKNVRGLNRLHQFDKVEIVQITHPEKSYNALQEMIKHVSLILDALELPYRIVRLCGGDLGFSSALTYDFEVYSAAQEKWLEVSSVSNFESYQANRLKLRYRDQDNKKKLCHTLNGSSLALPRIFAALIENNQSINGIKIPKAIQSYLDFDIIS